MLWRKRLALVLCAFMLLLSGCGDGASSEDIPSAPSASAPAGTTGAAGTSGTEAAGSLTVTVFNTGKSDCILLETAGAAMLIDTADKGDGEDIAAILRDRGITVLDILLLTHLDKDHIGGAASILEAVEVTRLIQPDTDEDSKQYKRYQEAASAAGAAPLRLTAPLALALGGAEVVLTPGEDPPYTEDNEYSILAAVTFGETRFLFMGDAEERRLTEFTAGQHGRFDFLKVPHHGRHNAMTDWFLQAVRPSYAVITCSKKDPAPEEIEGTLGALDALEARTFLTRDGDITAISDGKTLTVDQARQ